MELKIPAGTPIKREVAYTVDSLDVKAGERISFRVLVPIMVDGVTVIEKDALVTARITRAKRGGRWGGPASWRGAWKTWSPSTTVASLWRPKRPREVTSYGASKRNANSETVMGEGHIAGTSHGGQVAATSIAAGSFSHQPR